MSELLTFPLIKTHQEPLNNTIQILKNIIHPNSYIYHYFTLVQIMKESLKK